MAITPSALRVFAQLPPVEVVPDADLQAHIDMANLIRTEDFAASTFSSARLDAIELNLAAHFAILTFERGGFRSNLVGTSEDEYQLVDDSLLGFMSTRFGQAALSLDTTGTLSSMATIKPKAQFQVI